MTGHSEASGSGPPLLSKPPEGGMTKSAMKKAAKHARSEAAKPQRRLAEKMRRRERATALSEGYAAGTLSEADRALLEQRRQAQSLKKRAMNMIKEGGTRDDWKGGVIVDLGFDELMTDQEVTSMSSQLAYLYSDNRTAVRPFSTILHTSFSPTASPRLWEKMTKWACDRWTRSHWSAESLEGFSGAFSSSKEDLGLLKTEGELPAEGAKHSNIPASEHDHPRPVLPSTLNATYSLVYLSADSPNELTTLSEDEIYIIGGIVDRNRHKMLCQEKAESLGIRTARLPIGSYLEALPTRKVLTVNQVFAILLQYIAVRSWSAAFETVIPLRKYQSIKGTARSQKDNVEEDDKLSNDEDDGDDRLLGEDVDGDTEEALMNA